MSKMDQQTRMQQCIHVSREDIARGLEELGVKRGDCIGVHSSLSAFGYVEGGADAVIDALLEIVGPEGAVVAPTYSNNQETIDKTPEDHALGVTWKYRVLPYRPTEDSCWTGQIPDTFWRREEAVRGPNPSHSLAAIGAGADALAQGWDRLLEVDGYILLLGVTLGCCSSMHLAEQYVQLPQRILDRTTPPEELAKQYRSEEIHFGFGPYPDFELMEEPCRECGIMKSVKLGEADVKMVRLRELVDLYAEYLRRDPDRFYHD